MLKTYIELNKNHFVNANPSMNRFLSVFKYLKLFDGFLAIIISTNQSKIQMVDENGQTTMKPSVTYLTTYS